MSDLHLYVYDLSKGMAKQFSVMFLGKHFDGVWHTGIVAYGQEWFFGNDGIDSCPPEGTILGGPNEKIKLGTTDLTEDDFLEIIQQMSESTFKVGTYNLLEHNCNNFSNELAKILVGKGIPQHIIDLPKEIMNTQLGPMLRPMLEQAADPIHQMRTGQAPGFTRQFTKAAKEAQAAAASSTSTSVKTNDEVKEMPSTIVLFKPDFDAEFKLLLNHCQEIIKVNQNNLLCEIKEYLQQTKITWSISNSHVRCLFDLYLNHLSDFSHQITILKIFQKISLERTVAKFIAENENLIKEFLPKIKQSVAHDIKYHSLQMLSNVCAHNQISECLLKNHQDALFSELSDFILTETTSAVETQVLESSVSFFYNLISAYHLEVHLNESNALALGCALLERLPKMKLGPKSIYHLLNLVRSCLITSEDMRSLALSMDFDMSKYQIEQEDQNNNEEASQDKKNNELNSIVENIDELIKRK